MTPIKLPRLHILNNITQEHTDDISGATFACSCGQWRMKLPAKGADGGVKPSSRYNVVKKAHFNHARANR